MLHNQQPFFFSCSMQANTNQNLLSVHNTAAPSLRRAGSIAESCARPNLYTVCSGRTRIRVDWSMSSVLLASADPGVSGQAQAPSFRIAWVEEGRKPSRWMGSDLQHALLTFEAVYPAYLRGSVLWLTAATRIPAAIVELRAKRKRATNSSPSFASCTHPIGVALLTSDATRCTPRSRKAQCES